MSILTNISYTTQVDSSRNLLHKILSHKYMFIRSCPIVYVHTMDSFVDLGSEFRNYLYGTNFENITFNLTIHAENKISILA